MDSIAIATPGPNIISMPHLMADRREHMTAAPGTTIAEMVALALPGLTEGDRRNVRVTVGAAVVPEEWWAHTKPKPTATVVIRVVPTGGSFRSILAIAVTVAAVAAGQAWLAPSIVGAFGATGATATFLTAATGAVAGIAAAALVNSLIPAYPAEIGQTE